MYPFEQEPSMELIDPIDTNLALTYPEPLDPQSITPGSFNYSSDQRCSWTDTMDWGHYFPSCGELHLLLTQYFDIVHPVSHVIHRPTFENDCYNARRQSPGLVHATASIRALLVAMAYAAAVNLSDSQSELLLGVQKRSLVGKLKFATENALVEAQYMSSVNIQTLQAFTIFLVSKVLLLVEKCQLISVRYRNATRRYQGQSFHLSKPWYAMQSAPASIKIHQAWIPMRSKLKAGDYFGTKFASLTSRLQILKACSRSYTKMDFKICYRSIQMMQT